MNCKPLLMSTVAFGLLMAAPAYALESGSESVESDGEAPIIVTATLRAASVQDIPIAVTAVAPEALERQGISDLKSLASISASFNILSSQTETQGTAIKIRGVGTTGNNTGLESSVGVFIDGVYQSRPGVALGDLVDLERLEVLRGPQGTLFGRNTSAGALSITTRKPSLKDIDGFVNASYGNYDFMNLQAGVGVPVVEGVAAVRLTGSWRKRDGYLKSSTGDESNNRNRYMFRGQLYVEPNADVSLRVIADYSKVDENCCAAVIYRETELAPFFTALHGLSSDGVDQFGPSALTNLATNSQLFKNSARQWGISGELKWGLGGAELTYIGAYRDFDAESTQDADFTTLNVLAAGSGGSSSRPGILPNGDRIRSMTHELRLQGAAFDDKLDWLVGGFYGDEDIRADQSTSLGADFQRAVSAGNFANAFGVNPLLSLTRLASGGTITGPGVVTGGIPIDATGSYGENRFLQNGKTWSIFTHNVIDLTDRLSLTLGARYVDETKKASFDQLGASNAACQANVTGSLLGLIPSALRAGAVGLSCFPLAAPVNIAAPAALGGGLASRLLPLPREWSDTFKDNELTYTVQAAYKATDDILIYGSFSHGFKSGGFNLDPTAANLVNSSAVIAGLLAGRPVAPVYADPRFASEKVDAYEIGVKASFGRINANLALFQMDMSDFQVLEFTGVQFTTFNVAGARSRGAELEVFGKLHDYVSVNVAATYADAKYPSDCAVDAPADVAASVSLLCGQQLTNSPKFSGIFGITYDGPLNSSGWGLVTNFNINYSDRRRTSTQHLERTAAGAIVELPFDYQDAFFKMNARLGLTTPDGRYTFEVWGTNLSNEITRGVTANTPLRGGAGTRSRIAFVEEPRMYGITVRAKF